MTDMRYAVGELWGLRHVVLGSEEAQGGGRDSHVENMHPEACLRLEDVRMARQSLKPRTSCGDGGVVAVILRGMDAADWHWNT